MKPIDNPALYGRLANFPYSTSNLKYAGWKPLGWKSILKARNEDPIKWGSAWHIDLLGQTPQTYSGGLYAPVWARVAYGNGGAMSTFECDADNASFTVSAEVVEVSVSMTGISDINAFTVIKPAMVDYPLDYTVTGQARLTGQASNQACRLTKSYLISGVDSGGPTELDFEIPAKASSWCFVPTQEVGANDEPLEAAQVFSIGLFSAEVIGPEVCASMARMHAFRKLPPFATRFRATVADGWAGRLIFHLEI
jgi:hypothetical protein